MRSARASRFSANSIMELARQQERGGERQKTRALQGFRSPGGTAPSSASGGTWKPVVEAAGSAKHAEQGDSADDQQHHQLDQRLERRWRSTSPRCFSRVICGACRTAHRTGSGWRRTPAQLCWTAPRFSTRSDLVTARTWERDREGAQEHEQQGHQHPGRLAVIPKRQQKSASEVSWYSRLTFSARRNSTGLSTKVAWRRYRWSGTAGRWAVQPRCRSRSTRCRRRSTAYSDRMRYHACGHQPTIGGECDQEQHQQVAGTRLRIEVGHFMTHRSSRRSISRPPG